LTTCRNVQPENLQGVPRIAPDYRIGRPHALPELGRVGVDMTEQKPLSSEGSDNADGAGK
jgi:hypothetical protein